MKKGKFVLFGLAVMAAAAVGVTWAAWAQVLRTGNEYMIPKYKTSLEERFRQPDDWQPGITTQKQVWVSNDLKGEDGKTESGVPVIAKVEIHQSWIRRENVYEKDKDGNETAVPPLAGEPLPIAFQTDEGGSQYAAVANFNKENVVVLSSGMAKEEGLRLGLDYVDTPAEAKGKWLLVNEEPAEIGNYILYYMGIIQPGEDSPVFLESVTMNPLLENTIVTKDTYYEKTENGYKQVTVTNRNAKYGYDASRYTMDIKATTVQATKAAVEHTFTDGFYETVIYYLANEIADPAVYDASGLEKKLTLVFNNKKKRMEYIPYRTEDGTEEGNWFMTFTDMVPGGIYKDRLLIENTTDFQSATIYMRIVPRLQDEIKDELLEKITMRVIFQGEVLYEGKVTGAKYGEGATLQEVIPLCYLKPGQKEEVLVELQLDPTITCDPVTGACIYADQLTKIDWEFMIMQKTGGGDPGGPGGNNPGGDNPGGPGVPSSPGEPSDQGIPTVHIGDGDVPLATVMLPGDGIPLAALPRTGDDTNIPLLAAMSMVSLMLLVMTGVMFKKTREKE